MTDDIMPVEEPGAEEAEAVQRALPDVESIADLMSEYEDATFEVHSYASSDVRYHTIAVPVEDWVSFVQSAKDAGFDTFVDLAAVDHFADAPRFEVALNLISMTEKERIIISTRVPYDAASVPTVTGVFVGANFYEREAYDLVGIDFPGHPDLTRILLPDDWEGHPLRKDYNVGAVPVEFKAGSVDL